MKPYDERTDARRGPLVERLLAVAVLLVLWLLVSTVVVWGDPIDPAGAFPADTLLFADLREPLNTIDTLSGMPPWQKFENLLGAAAETGADEDGIVPVLRHVMAAWRDDAQLREQLRALAGDRLVFGIVPGADGQPPSPVIVLRGGLPAAQLEALAALLLRLGPRAAAEVRWTGDAFHLVAGDGTVLLEVRVTGGWLLLGRPGDSGPLRAVAEALASGEVRPSSLAALEPYREAMARLPETAAVHGFVNVPAIAVRTGQLPGLPASAAGAVARTLECFDGFGFAREIDPLAIRTRVAGRLAAGRPTSRLCDLVHSLEPLAEPLSRRLPAEALATHDLGAPPGALFKLIAGALTEADGAGAGSPSAFSEASGLDPATDLFPYLGRRVASALLPAPTTSGDIPLPRPVAVAETSDEAAVRAFLDTLLRWEAGEVAARSEGLVSARVVAETHEGVEIRGLEIESVVPGPLPSPSYAVTDGLLVVSPMRSAVREAISSIHATAGTVQPLIEGSPVELVHADLCALVGELGRGLSPLLSRLRQGDGLPVVGPDLDRLTRLAPPLLALVGSLGQAEGWTMLATDGAFDATFELHPRECATGLDQLQQARPAARRARPSLSE